MGRRDHSAPCDVCGEDRGGLVDALRAQLAQARSDLEGLDKICRENDRLRAEARTRRRFLSDGIEAAVGQRVATVREACARDGLAHAHDDLVHEITSLLGGDTGLVECGPRQISVRHLRLADDGAVVTCTACAGWREQREQWRLDAEVHRRTRAVESRLATMRALLGEAREEIREAWSNVGDYAREKHEDCELAARIDAALKETA